MRTRILGLLVVVTAAALTVQQASAELIIYKGTLKQSATGQGISRKLNSKFYLIVDHDTANVAQIMYTTVNGSKYYSTATNTNLEIMQVSAPKGKTMEAIVESLSSCDVEQGQTGNGVLVQGTDANLKVSTNSTITFPNTLSGSGSVVSSSSGPAVYVTSSVTVSFDSVQTPLSNGNGETLDAALSRISTMLEGQGYNQDSAKRTSAKGLLSWPSF